MPARVTAVVVTFGHAEEIAACVHALLKEDVTGGLEVVVVDNASTDGTAEVVEAISDPRVRLIRNATNTGYAAGCNTGAALAEGDFLLLVNPDCVVDAGCVPALVERLSSEPGVGAVSADLRYPDGTPQSFCRRDLTLGLVLWDLTWRGRAWDHKHRGDRGRRWRRYAEQTENPPEGPWETDCPAAACVLLWRQLVRGGLMAPELPLFFNDGDLYKRLLARGYRVEVLPEATATHAYSTSLQRLPDARKRAEFVAALRLWARRWWPLRRRIGLTVLLLLDAVLSRGYWRRGTLGGLGLPGGAQPWLTTYPPLPKRVRLGIRTLREAGRLWRVDARRRRDRRYVMRQWRRAARRNGAHLVLDVARDAVIARDVVVELRRRQHVVLRIAERGEIQRAVVLRLWGGELAIGFAAQVRHGAVLTVKGRLELAPRVVISRGVSVHADGDLVMEFGVGVAEGATVVDSSHILGTHLPVFDLPTVQKDIRLGAGCFIGANAVVTAGVHVGRRAVVGAGSVVTRDVPDDGFVSGMAAKLREAPSAKEQSAQP